MKFKPMKIKQSDGKIGTREFTAIIILTIGIKFSDSTPSLLFEHTKTAAWISPFVFLICMGVPFLLLLSLLKKHKDKNLITLIKYYFGKPVGTLAGGILVLIMLGGCVFNSRSYVDIISVMFFTKTPVHFLLFVLLVTSYYVANRGFETIGRTSWLILPYITVVVFVLIIAVFPLFNVSNLFPIWGPGFIPLLKQSFSHSSLFSEMIILTVFYPYLRTDKDFRIASYIGWGFVTIQFAFFLAVYVMIYDFPSVQFMNYHFQHLTRSAQFGTITHVESVFLGFWVMASIVHFSIYLYTTTALLGYTLNIQEFEPLLLPVTGLVFLLALIPENIVTTIYLGRNLMLIGATYIVIMIPILLWCMDKIRRKAT